MEPRKRKPNRLKDYDYSETGAYFVTACIKEKHCILGDILVVGERSALPQVKMKLSDIGLVVQRVIEEIPLHYPNLSVDQYVIMPNHVHLLIVIRGYDLHCDKSDEGCSDEKNRFFDLAAFLSRPHHTK